MKKPVILSILFFIGCGGDEFSSSADPAGSAPGGGGGSAGAASSAGGASQGGAGTGGSAGIAGNSGGSGGAAAAGQPGSGGSAGVAGSGGEPGSGGASGSTSGGASGAGAAGQGGGAGSGGAGKGGGGGSGGASCTKGTFACDGATLSLCSGDPPSLQPKLNCGKPERCSAATGECFSCSPGETLGCVNETTRATCTADGKPEGMLGCPGNLPWCDKGECAVCVKDEQCPSSGNPCEPAVCVNHQCTTKKSPMGTLLPMQTVGDCKKSVCDGDGKVVIVADASDPVTGFADPCSIPICVGDQTALGPADKGKPCKINLMDGACDGQGGCVLCSEGETRCNDDLEVCKNGVWSPAPCGPSTPACNQGACVGITALSAGEKHSCALFSDGHVRCWGAGASGELGNGKTEDSFKPVKVEGLSDAVQISSGNHHTCALRAGGKIVCWGSSTRAQISPVQPIFTAPADITSFSDFQGHFVDNTKNKFVVAGGTNTCALAQDEVLYCWGDNDSHQVDDSAVSPVSIGTVSLPVTPSIVRATIGDGFICVQGSNGSAYCRGRSEITSAKKPSDPYEINLFATPISEIDAGKSHVCVRGPSRVDCWGNGSSSVAGTLTGTFVFADSAKISPAGSFLSLGDKYTCQISGSGVVECAGPNRSGQLGDPLAVSSSKVGAGATMLVTGTSHSCAFFSGKGLRCWGNNDAGQAGVSPVSSVGSPADVTWY